jgi:biotin carboxyl carrier protein
MAYIATVDGKERTVDVKQLEEGVFAVTIDGDRHLTLDVRRKGCCSFSVLHEGASYEVDLDANGEGKCEVLIRDEFFDVEVIDEMRKKMMAILGESAGVGSGEISTAMPGKVVKVFVKEGDTVEAGDPVVVLEAMKMENEFKAPEKGVVKAVNVKEGDVVESGAVLVVVDVESEE